VESPTPSLAEFSWREMASTHVGVSCIAVAGTDAEATYQVAGNDILEKLSWLEFMTGSVDYNQRDLQRRYDALADKVDIIAKEIREDKDSRQVELANESFIRQSEVGEIRERLDRMQVPHASSSSTCVLESCLEEVEESSKDGTPASGRGNGAVHEVVQDMRQAEVQLRRTINDARRLESQVRRQVRHEVEKARVFMRDSWSLPSDSSRKAPIEGEEAEKSEASGSPVVPDISGLGIRAFEVHIRARIEDVEHNVRSCRDDCHRVADELRNSINQLHKFVDGSIQTLNANLCDIPSKVDAVLGQTSADIRQEWQEALQEERQIGASQAQAMAKGLTEDLEKSIVAQSVAEVRAEVRIAVRSVNEAITRTKEQTEALWGRVGVVESRMGIEKEKGVGTPTAGAGSTGSTGNEDMPSSMGSGPSGVSFSEGTLILQGFGEKVAQLDSAIGALVSSNQEAAAKQRENNSELWREINELRRLMEQSRAELLETVAARQDSSILESSCSSKGVLSPAANGYNGGDPSIVPVPDAPPDVKIADEKMLPPFRLERQPRVLMEPSTVDNTAVQRRAPAMRFHPSERVEAQAGDTTEVRQAASPCRRTPLAGQGAALVSTVVATKTPTTPGYCSTVTHGAGHPRRVMLPAGRSRSPAEDCASRLPPTMHVAWSPPTDGNSQQDIPCTEAALRVVATTPSNAPPVPLAISAARPPSPPVPASKLVGVPTRHGSLGGSLAVRAGTSNFQAGQPTAACSQNQALPLGQAQRSRSLPSCTQECLRAPSNVQEVVVCATTIPQSPPLTRPQAAASPRSSSKLVPHRAPSREVVSTSPSRAQVRTTRQAREGRVVARPGYSQPSG